MADSCALERAGALEKGVRVARGEPGQCLLTPFEINLEIKNCNYPFFCPPSLSFPNFFCTTFCLKKKKSPVSTAMIVCLSVPSLQWEGCIVHICLLPGNCHTIMRPYCFTARRELSFIPGWCHYSLPSQLHLCAELQNFSCMLFRRVVGDISQSYVGHSRPMSSYYDIKMWKTYTAREIYVLWWPTYSATKGNLTNVEKNKPLIGSLSCRYMHKSILAYKTSDRVHFMCII